MKLGGRMGIGSAETLENFLADLFVHGDMGRICVCLYSGLTLNQYGVASPCRTICTVYGFVALS